MKKLFALLAVVLAVVSCQKDAGLDVNVGGEQLVNITVALPEATRAASGTGFNLNTLVDSNYELRYILEIYVEGNTEDCIRQEVFTTEQSVVFPVRLVPQRNYRVVAWADIVKKGENTDLYYNTQKGLDEVTIIENANMEWNAMDEYRDAYTAYQVVNKFTANTSINLTLKRPFAKLRVVSTDIKNIEDLGYTLNYGEVFYSVKLNRTFNALEGKSFNDGEENHTFYYPTPYANDSYETKTRRTLFADYIFVDDIEQQDAVKFTMSVYAQDGLLKTTTFNTDIALRANTLTTIIGEVLTEGGNVQIEIDGELNDDQAKDYTVVSSASHLLNVINAGGEYILGNDIIVTEADAAEAEGIITRAAGVANEPKTTTINLNGKTITIINKSNKPLVTVPAGNTLTFTDNTDTGSIVLAEDSTESFIENEGTVILEAGTITNQNNDKPVIDGKIVIDGATVNDNKVEESNKLDNNAEWFADVIANGGTVILSDDMSFNHNIEVTAENPVVIDGNGKTINFTTANGNRGFRIQAANTVTFKNVTIVNNVYEGRCIDTRVGGINLTLENVILTTTATNSNTQPLTVGGYGDNITVNINNSTINAGKSGYGITTFNPVALNINGSTITGYAALYMKDADSSMGSVGSEINIVHSTLNGGNDVTTDESNSFATIEIEDNNIEINVDSTSTVKATTSKGNGQCIVGFGNETVTSKISGCNLTIAGDIVLEGDDTSFVGYSEYQGGLGKNTVKFAEDYADELEAEGWIVGESTDGLVTISSAIAQVGETKYATLNDAVAAVKDGDTITLVADEVFTKENCTLNSGSWYDGLYYVGDKSFTIDLGGKTISQDGAVNDYLLNFKNDGAKANTITLKNGTIDAGTAAFCALCTSSSNKSKITINLEKVNLVGNNSNGAVAKIRGGAELNVKAGTVITGKNNYVGIEAVGNNTVVNIYDNVNIYQNGTGSYVGAIVGASYNATMNIYGGYGKSAKCGIIVMSTGATINVSGGEWIANNDGTVAAGNNGVLVSQNNRNEKGWACKSILNVTGGTFKGGYDCWGMGPGVEPDDAQINIKGGNFNANPASYVVEGYEAIDNENGTWVVR